MPTDKLADCPELREFLQKESTATIAVPIDDDGTMHAAALLYWHSEHPLRFYFVTSKNSEKCTLLRDRKSLPAACVVGTSRGTDMTLQMRGTLAIVEKEVFKTEVEEYYEKRGNHHDDVIDPDNVFLQFTPNWARYTDYTKNYERRMLDVKE